ncbi:hypothetical protein, partial [Mycobacterium tuberculosis]|uniref:hypothetical protein n=1 Tax=Mycobacterium tuberculosis TaxID=1773 RepID=UPI001587D3DC
IARNTLSEVTEQITMEKQYESYEYVTATLEKHNITTLLNELTFDFPESHFNEFYGNLLDLLKPSNAKPIHRSSFEQQNEVYSMHKQIKALDTQNYISLFEENSLLLEKSQELRKTIELNDTSSEFKELLERIEERNRRLESIKLRSEQIISEVEKINDLINTKESMLYKINDRIREYYKSE